MFYLTQHVTISLRSHGMWTHKKKVNSCTIVFQSLLIELLTFKASSEQLRHHCHLRPLKLVEGVHIFYLDINLLNLEICSSKFICLKFPTRSIKTVKIETSLPNDVSLAFSFLSLNYTLIMVLNLWLTNFDWIIIFLISFNCIYNYF